VKIKAVKSDTEKLKLDQLLWDVLWEPLKLPRNVRRTYSSGRPEIELIALSQRKAIGGLVANQLSEDRFEIRHLAVRPEYQRQSVGRLLVQELLKRIRKRSTVRLQTYARNTSSGFFSRLGFKQTGDFVEHKDFTEHGIRFQRMELKASPPD
jgi:ribosomal protein S18 acetylase RimI-like enzyme